MNRICPQVWAATILVLLAFHGTAIAAPLPDLRHGEALAKANCATCHALGPEDSSPNKAAPPFRTLGERFPVETIDEALLAKLRPGHPDMPSFTMTPKQAADIGAFIGWTQPVEHGKRLVEENCARCHATGKDGESRHKDAPPFRQLSLLYPIDALEEAFVEGIETGHPDMPVFTATPTQISNMLDYIASIQEN